MNFREELERIISENQNKYIMDDDLYKYITNILIPNKKDIPLLYRYMPANYNSIRNLETGELYLSDVGNMNDIFEGLTCEINDRVIDRLDKFIDIACLKSFSENKNDLRMWSIYGDNYSGMCVEYDLKDMIDDYYYHFFPVVYRSDRVTKANLEYSIDELVNLKRSYENGSMPDDVAFLKDIMTLFLIKSKSWEYEKEWRLICTFLQMEESHNSVNKNEDDLDHEEFYRLDAQLIKFDYVKKVFIGPKMKENIKEHIAAICEDKGIEVYKTKLSKDKYELEAELYERKN